MWLNFIKTLIMAFAICAVLSACGNNKDTVQSAPDDDSTENRIESGDNADNTKQNSLVLSIGGEPEEGYDPCTGWGRYGNPLFQSTLLFFDKDMNIINDLAESYNVSEDGLIWTFKIRSDAKFSNGDPVSASDVAFTFNTTKETDSEFDLTRMEKAVAVNDTTVEFHMVQPMSAFLYTTVMLGIVPEKLYSENYGQSPIGSGPYKFVQWDKGQQLIIERNEDYYGQKPEFKNVTFLYYGEDASFAAVQAGEIDIAATTPSLVRDLPGYSLVRCQSVDNRGMSLPATKSGTVNPDGLPVGNDVTSDINIRKALIYGIEREQIILDALSGYGTEAYSVSDGLPWGNLEVKITDGDVEGQKKVLEATGWIDTDGDGIREKDGLKAAFELYYPANDSVRQAICFSVAQQAKALGIEITPKGGSWDDIGAVMYAAPVMFGWGSHNPMEVYNLYYGKNVTEGYNNVTNMVNPAVDKYMDAALSSTTFEESNENWKKAEWDGTTGHSSLGDATWCWIANIEHLYYVRDGIDIGEQRIHPHGHGYPILYNITEWKTK